MTSASEIGILVASYSEWSSGSLYAELGRQTEAAHHAEEPTEPELAKEGATQWASVRRRFAQFVCSRSNPQAPTADAIDAAVSAGLGAFVEAIGETLLGNNILPRVTSAVAAVTIVLLYREMRQGIRAFCLVYYSGEA